jgi:dinuclear metal center YbgI/SA1388 family protein
MPAPLTDVVAELDRLLEPARFKDYGPNGLQFPGRADVGRVATAVSASVSTFELALERDADLLVVHHGLFWGSGPAAIDAAMKRRLKLLFDADMSLAAYHLPLDAHPQVGNNVLIAQALGARETQPFALHEGEPIGVLADFDGEGAGEGIRADVLFARIAEVTRREPLVFDAGPRRVRRLGIVSGAGASYLDEAAACGADAFLTGEPAERVMAQARESGVHFVAAGHYATEIFGVRRLGEHLSERFDVEHAFLDVPNPV